jgi:hypothetical protein
MFRQKQILDGTEVTLLHRKSQQTTFFTDQRCRDETFRPKITPPLGTATFLSSKYVSAETDQIKHERNYSQIRLKSATVTHSDEREGSTKSLQKHT